MYIGGFGFKRDEAIPENGLLTSLVSYRDLQSDANDSHGSNNGTATNVTRSSAAVFNGSSSKITVGDIDFTGSYSFNMWAKRTVTGSKVIIDKFASGGTNPIRLAQNSSTRLYSQTYDGSSTDTATATGSHNNDSWHMVTFVRDFSGGNLYLYVDETSVRSDPIGLASDLTNNASLTFGALAINAAYWAGSLKDCALWTKPLDTSDIGALYNSGSGIGYSSFN